MIDTDGLRLLSQLSNFLDNPVIKLEHSDEVLSLRSHIADLQRLNDDLQKQYESIVSKYRQEVDLCLRLQDTLREHGIKWR